MDEGTAFRKLHFVFLDKLHNCRLSSVFNCSSGYNTVIHDANTYFAVFPERGITDCESLMSWNFVLFVYLTQHDTWLCHQWSSLITHQHCSSVTNSNRYWISDVKTIIDQLIFNLFHVSLPHYHQNNIIKTHRWQPTKSPDNDLRCTFPNEVSYTFTDQGMELWLFPVLERWQNYEGWRLADSKWKHWIFFLWNADLEPSCQVWKYFCPRWQTYCHC